MASSKKIGRKRIKKSVEKAKFLAQKMDHLKKKTVEKSIILKNLNFRGFRGFNEF